jgi:Leucine-rich repeat (LRR) protein
MKKLYPLLSVLFLIYWGCDDPKEENKPTPVTLSVDSGVLKWNMNEEDDFFRYSLYGSNNSSMENKTLIYETQSRLDTTHTFDSNEYFLYYQVDVMNLNEMVSSSNILNVGVYLWGVYYSIENTYSLDLPYNQLTGEIPPEIWNLTNLTYLDLGWNQLTGSIPPEIGNLTNLTYLDLDFNQLTGSIPSQIGNLTNLERLSLHNNQLTGSTPSEIGNLTNLNYLGLKNNQLTGEIPPEISNLTNLEDLNLSYNQLSGSIPPEIGNLTNLTHLSLKSNELTGEIPESICDLNINWSNSYYFHISNNQLCPPYPPCIEDYVGEQDTSDCD